MENKQSLIKHVVIMFEKNHGSSRATFVTEFNGKQACPMKNIEMRKLSDEMLGDEVSMNNNMK